MRPTEEQDQLEKAKAEQFIAEVPLMPGVEGVRVELADDHDGDPAMWLVFRLKSNLKFDIPMARQFNEYAAVIQTKILHSGLTRFPYTRLERAACPFRRHCLYTLGNSSHPACPMILLKTPNSVEQSPARITQCFI